MPVLLTSSADDADFLVPANVQIEMLQCRRQSGPVGHDHVFEFDTSRIRPRGRRLSLRNVMRRFLLKMIRVFEDTLVKRNVSHSLATVAGSTYINTVRVILHFCKLTDNPGEGLLQSHRIRQNLERMGSSMLFRAKDGTHLLDLSLPERWYRSRPQ